jgi:hypothetical protein
MIWMKANSNLEGQTRIVWRRSSISVATLLGAWIFEAVDRDGEEGRIQEGSVGGASEGRNGAMVTCV